MQNQSLSGSKHRLPSAQNGTLQADVAFKSPAADEAIRASKVEFRSEVIYFIVVDRFADGIPDNTGVRSDLNDPTQRDWTKYWGGDLQGILDKLDYLQRIGVTALWLTPLFEQVEAINGNEAPLH